MARNKKRNPALAAALLAPTAISLIKRTRKRRDKARARLEREVKAGPSMVGSGRIAKSAALASAASFAIPAPVAEGVVTRGSQWSFGAAPPRNGSQGVRIHGKQLWATLQTDATPHLGNPIWTAGSTNVSALSFDPDDTQTMWAPLTSFATCFARYVLRKARIIFTPAAATSLGAQLSMAVTTDAAYANNSSASGWFGKTASWVGYLMEQSNSVTGPIWQSLALDVPCDDTLRYVFQTGADSAISAAEERQDHAFVLGASLQQGSSTLPAAATVYGYFHIEYMVDFYEVVATADETSLGRLRRRMRVLERRVVSSDSMKPVASRATEEREEKKGRIFTSPEDSPQGSLSGGWDRVPVEPLSTAGLRATVTADGGERAGSVKSRSLKG